MAAYGVLISASTDTAALSNPSVTTTEPTTAVHNIDKRSMARLLFGGTDAADETVNYQVILWSASWLTNTKVWTPVIAAKGAFTLGDASLPTSLVAVGLFADTITETLVQPGSIARSPADDSIASLEINLRDADVIQVETDLGTAAAAYVMIQFSDREVNTFADVIVDNISVAGTGLATSAIQTTTETKLTAMAADVTQMNAFTASGLTIEDLEYVSIAQVGAGAAAIKADLSDYHYYLMGLWGTVDTAATTIQLRETDNAPVYGGAMQFNDNNGLVMAVTGFPYIITADSKGLEMDCSGGGFNGTAIVLKVAN